MELYRPSTEPATRSVSCGDFNLKSGRPKILPQASLSHQVKPFDIGKDIVKVYPKKGEIWALYKSGDSTKEEHDIVEVKEDYSNGEVLKAVALTAKGSSSLFMIQRKQGSNEGVIDIPKAEMSRFSHQIPAVKHEKRTTRLVEGGYWELDPEAIPCRTIVLD
ncbi:hypothetical protein V5N11_023665 [Cardamine amara subsp. amara]|uniref:DUF3444 domain-containing protein n=1 Tax=Cardamine amara subsp. amara TaxID=228776 RepID=A0ABD1BGS8_CARAN